MIDTFGVVIIVIIIGVMIITAFRLYHEWKLIPNTPPKTTRIQNLTKLIKELTVLLQCAEEVNFEYITTNIQNVLNCSDITLADLFDVSVPTVKSWKIGKTSPHKNVRIHFIKTALLNLLTLLEENLRAKYDR